jgi:hypothetical protein
MEIPVFQGQWIASLKQMMDTSVSGDTFVLPSIIHLHAFEKVNKEFYPDKKFQVKLDF